MARETMTGHVTKSSVSELEELEENIEAGFLSDALKGHLLSEEMTFLREGPS